MYTREMSLFSEMDYEVGMTGGPNSYVEFGIATGIIRQFTWKKGYGRPFTHNQFQLVSFGASTTQYSKDR